MYFPGLNTLRFYAAFSVIIAHIALNFAELRTQGSIIPLLDYLVMDAQTAVTLFFVLSGFLITALLLVERDRTATIHVRKFYMRRILRIWPLYYLVAVAGFFIFPLFLDATYALHDAPFRSVVLVFVLLPNLVGPLGPLGHLWTIGLEEQFYVVMPWLVKKHRLIFVCSIVITIKLLLEPVVLVFNSDAMLNLFHGMRFEAMSIGAVGAWLYHQRHAALRYIYHPLAQAVAAALFVGVALVDIPVSSVNTFILSVGFIVLIMNVATNPKSPLCIETPITTYFGTRSYGLYIYHFPILYLTLWLLREAGITEGAQFDLLLYAITIGATVIITDLSFRWLERPLLRFKTHFAIVHSRTSEHDDQAGEADPALETTKATP